MGPFLLRKAMRLLEGCNADGDGWNYCHFWSNFEIGDMDFFRSADAAEYRNFFDALDRSGGFYFERWGDDPVHSFGVGLFLEPSEVHYFEDIGYIHDNI
jgi:Glycolipid 2-alpha-mannosyltransferase